MAIAFDAATVTGSHVTATSHTFSHTCSGSDRLLFVSYMGTNAASDVVTGATYAGTSMTRIGTSFKVPSDRYIGLFYLINPASGANNVVISASSSDVLKGNAISYTGCSQSSQCDVTDTATATAQNYSDSLTTITDNSWVMMFTKNNTGSATAGSGTTIRMNNDGYGMHMSDNNSAKTPAGSVTLTHNSSSSRGWGGYIVTILPATGGGGTTWTPKIIIF